MDRMIRFLKIFWRFLLIKEFMFREIPCDSVAKEKKGDPSMKKKWIELAVKVAVAALTAFLTALGTTSCMDL